MLSQKPNFDNRTYLLYFYFMSSVSLEALYSEQFALMQEPDIQDCFVSTRFADDYYFGSRFGLSVIGDVSLGSAKTVVDVGSGAGVFLEEAKFTLLV
jgi:hypothetical protein